jgi:hypothetical protein
MYIIAWLLACLAVAGLMPHSASAHEMRPIIASLKPLADGSYHLTLQGNFEALLAGIGAEHDDTSESPNATLYNQLRALPEDQLSDRLAAMTSDLTDGLTLTADTGGAADIALQTITVPPVGDPALARISTLTFTAVLPAATPRTSWQWQTAFGDSILRVEDPAGVVTYSAYIKTGGSSDAFALTGAQALSLFQVARNYMGIGFDHIVPRGLDHILFVLGLFLLSTHWRPLLAQVTAFTVAHTVTLALGLLQIVSLPTSIVEPLIAVSIVYVALENTLVSTLHRWRPVVVFGFGLLHGLGFAGFLGDIGLPTNAFVTGLISFNIGVELGQLTVIALAYAAVGLWWGNASWYRRLVVLPGSLAIAAIGCWWVVERTLLS